MLKIEDMVGKIYNADCLEIMRQMPDKCVDLVLTDIPYGEVNMGDNGLRKLNKGNADVVLFCLSELLSEIVRISRGSIYIFCGTEQVSQIRGTLKIEGLSTRHCIWEKTNPSPMNGKHIWLSSIENCIFAKNSGAYFSEKCASSVWKYPCGASKGHPTQKPIKLFEKLISVSSESGMIIFDPFLGSGTTALAAERLGRKWIGCELEPKYCAIAQARVDAERAQGKLF